MNFDDIKEIEKRVSKYLPCAETNYLGKACTSKAIAKVIRTLGKKKYKTIDVCETHLLDTDKIVYRYKMVSGRPSIPFEQSTDLSYFDND